MNQPVGVGVLGVGRMGQFHCQLITDTPGLSLIAASSAAPELTKAVEEKFAIHTYNKHHELLNDPEIQWVVIATTTDKHREWALKSINSGKNIIVEKPVALSAKEAEEIFTLAERAGVRVTVYQSRRWDEDFKLVRKVIKEDLLGEVYRLESRYTDFNPGWAAWGAQGEANPWRLKKKFGGGLLNDWGPHLFDQLFILVDSKVSSVYGKTYKKIWSTEVEDHFWAEVIFESGLSALIEASNNYRVPQARWCLVGTEGTLYIGGGDPADWNSAIIKRSLGGSLEETRIDITQPELSSGFYEAFAAALSGSAQLPVTPDQVLRAMRMMEAVAESDRTGASVAFKS